MLVRDPRGLWWGMTKVIHLKLFSQCGEDNKSVIGALH